MWKITKPVIKTNSSENMYGSKSELCVFKFVVNKSIKNFTIIILGFYTEGYKMFPFVPFTGFYKK